MGNPEYSQHVDKTIIPEKSKEKIPIEIETKIINVGTASEIRNKLGTELGEPLVERRLLDDQRFIWEKGGAGLEKATINPGFFKDKQKLRQALELMGLIVEEDDKGRFVVAKKMRKQAMTIRLRTEFNEQPQVFFTVKEKRHPAEPDSDDPSKKIDHRKEVEVGVANEDELINFLGRIGLSLEAHRQKYRTSWKFNGCIVELNEPPGGIDPWLEIEGSDNKIIDTIEKLGFKPEQVVSMSDKKYLLLKGVSEKQAQNFVFPPEE